MLRVIAGTHRSRKLEKPQSEAIRPTKDNVKEAIFSSLQGKMDGAIVLDLFAGSGSLAIEALSRGAMKALLVDNAAEAINTITTNLRNLQIRNYELSRMDALDFLRWKRGAKFDLIFVDPPYNRLDLYNKSLELIVKYDSLAFQGLVVMEIGAHQQVTIPHGLTIFNSKAYGKTNILFLSKIH